MNQHLIIVFISFLLITILLLLLAAHGKEKSRRIRVLVDISGYPGGIGFREFLKSSLDKTDSARPLTFLFTDENAATNPDLTNRNRVTLVVVEGLEEKNEFRVFPSDAAAVLLIIGSPNTFSQDSSFLSALADILFQTANP